MKIKLFLCLFLSFFLFMPQAAAEDLTCEDLAEIADVLDEVADAIDEVGSIKEDSELDKALGEVLDALELLASVEGNQKINKSVKQLADAWDKLDWGKFKLALDSVIANLDRIRRADCD